MIGSTVVAGEECIFSIQSNLAAILPISGRMPSSDIHGIRYAAGARVVF